MYLQPANQKPAADFLTSPLWTDWKRALNARRPPPPDPKEDIHVSAARGHVRAGFEKAIEEFEKLPFEFAKEPPSPFSRPAVSITKD